jgi:predicted aspartyl protease
MGHTWIDLDVANLEGTKSKRVRGLVDTGATLTTLPRALAEELEVKIVSRDEVETGAGRIQIEKGRVCLAIGKKEDVQTVWVSEVIDKVLVGCVTMEVLGLKVNPVTGKIEETPLLLY